MKRINEFPFYKNVLKTEYEVNTSHFAIPALNSQSLLIILNMIMLTIHGSKFHESFILTNIYLQEVILAFYIGYTYYKIIFCIFMNQKI